jgi:hypothetical protein
MKPTLFIVAAIAAAGGCDVHVHNPPENKVEKNTTVVNPPATEEKKVEKNTTIVNPPPKEEKKVENNTTIVNPPAEKK